MSSLQVMVQGIGFVGPGLASWAAARAVLAGEAAYAPAPTILPPPPRLPAAERRRAGPSVRVAMAVAEEAVAMAGVDPSRLATVFAASGGEGSNCHLLCETLAGSDRQLSPTRFTNSVHNAPAGYWHIAVASQAASTSLSAFDGSFGAGLLEAATQVQSQRAPVLLVACDVPYPEPLHRLRPLPHPVGTALLLAPAPATGGQARIAIELAAADRAGAPTSCADAALEALRRQVPAATALPLLQSFARPLGAADVVVLDYLAALKLRIRVGDVGART